MTLDVRQTELRRAEMENEVRRGLADQTMPEERVTAGPSHKLKVQTYDGTDDFKDYLEQFNTIANESRWSYHYKGVVLLASLKGKARATVKDLKDFDEIVVRLLRRYSQENEDMFAQELQVLVQKDSQSWEDLAEEAQTLAERGYRESGANAQQRLSVVQSRTTT